MAKGVLPFLKWAEGECARAGVELQLLPKKRQNGAGGGWKGHFSSSRIAVCVHREDWTTVLAHEISHLLQDKEGKWPDLTDADYNAWLEGKKRVPARKLLALTRRIQRSELDCERRALRLIREFGLCEDPGRYVQGACAYVWSYEYGRRYRSIWYDHGIEMMDHPELLALLPRRLMSVRDIGKIPPEFEAQMLALCS